MTHYPTRIISREVFKLSVNFFLKIYFQLFSLLSKNIYRSISLSWISSIQFEMIFRYRYELTFKFISVIVWSHLIFNFHSREWASVLVRIINMSIELLFKLSEIHIFLITKSSTIFLTRTLFIFKEKSNRNRSWRSLSRWSNTLGWWARRWRRRSISTIIIYYLRSLNSIRIDENALYLFIYNFFFKSGYNCTFIVIRFIFISEKILRRLYDFVIKYSRILFFIFHGCTDKRDSSLVSKDLKYAHS